MKKIDGHLHLVRSVSGYNGKGRMTPLGDGKAIWDNGMPLKLIPDGWGDDDFLAESALKVMDENGINKAVLLQGSLYAFQNYYTYQTVKKYPDRFIGAFSFDPFSDEAMTSVKRHIDDLGFRAVKLEISQGGGLMGYHHAFRLDNDPQLGLFFHYISDYPGFVVTVDYGDYTQLSHQPEAIANLAQRYPQLDFVVCHLSFPNADHLNRLECELRQWEPYPNISVELSAIEDIEGETEFPYPRCQKDTALAKKVLGAKRIFWGTDSPWSSTFNSYHNLATWLEATDIFTESELEDVFYNNPERIYFKPQNVKAVADAVDPITGE
ncbi:amidohydrolase family protein [Bifidobacterium sp. ESL0690]|uniref:amidohydrolase family protein n=1 Tax=Bifidobacterium sp. ESL0690 TaxID=2983214 RepID=UPI0023F9A2FB|nr:amidohydrolase family protein [Bifidobacterium sp. ESL0690]WEV46049.1 amidohydrolase family protein [Bifidobacterium sp. ESL0690]